MKLTIRWYGEKDCIPLNYIKQIQGMTGVVTAVYDVPVGDIWELSKLERLKSLCNNAGLEMEVIESVPVHEDIKLGKPTRDKLIANYAQNIINCGKVGVKCVCYNFMPVFDWFRTNLYYKHADGSTSLSYSEADFNKLDKHNLRLPGWDERGGAGLTLIPDLCNGYGSFSWPCSLQRLLSGRGLWLPCLNLTAPTGVLQGTCCSRYGN